MNGGCQLNLYQQFAAALRRTEWLRRGELDSYRSHLLKRLVTFAATQSPFYAERLKPLFRRGPDPQVEAWSEIPLLRRQELESDIERIKPESVPQEAGAVSTIRTSGTTGSRIEFQTCMLARVAAECMMHRHYCWHGLDFTAPMASVRFYGSGRRTYPDGITEQNWSAVQPGGKHHTLDVREAVGDIIAWLVRRAPKYLLTFPSLVYDLANHPNAAAISGLKLGKIIGISESLTPYIGAVAQDKLGCEIAQIYACAEMGCIALQAPGDDCYLACEETVFVEILGESGDPVKPGQTGRVVLTSLYNYATPFIRYEIGDYATLAETAGESGRALMRLQRIDGRSSGALRSISGQRIWPHELPLSELATHLSSCRFQIRQRDTTHIEVIFVPEGHRSPDEIQLAAIFAHIMGGEVDVQLIPVRDLARTTGGKREFIVSMAHTAP